MTKDRFTKRVKVTVSVSPPFSLRWLNEFWKLRCAEDLIGLFPNPKEVTESMAAFGALRKIKGLDLMALYKRPDVVCLVPGDGTLPRTGAMVALRTNWTVYSVDPQMTVGAITSGGAWHTVIRGRTYRRLISIPLKIEDIPPILCGVGIILAVHSHAPLEVAWEKLIASEQKIAVAIPCCVYQKIPGVDIDTEYQDSGIFSAEDTVRIWRA